MSATRGRDLPAVITDLYALVTDESSEPIERLLASQELRSRLRTFARQLVGDARDDGASWAQIGAALDCSRQAAQQRFG